MVRRAAFRHGRHLQDLCREFSRRGTFEFDRQRSAGDCGPRVGAGGVSVFPQGYRGAGLLLHVTSLPSRYGIGDIGPAALAWVDRLRDAGQSWWQALPLGPTGYGNSPYQPLSSFAGNELLISPDWLIEDGLLRERDCEGTFASNDIDYEAVISYKRHLLKTAWANLAARTRGDLRADYERFRQDQSHWLEDYALFRALKAKFNGAYFLDWPREFVERVPSKLAEARRDLADTIELVSFAQWII